MNETEKKALIDAIDLTVSCAGLIAALRREVHALENLVPPEKRKEFQTAFADADERGESLYDRLLEDSRKLAAAKDLLRTPNTQAGAL
jgi:hypothetical protein